MERLQLDAEAQLAEPCRDQGAGFVQPRRTGFPRQREEAAG